jgi:trimeric autotransporter adhesin
MSQMSSKPFIDSLDKPLPEAPVWRSQTNSDFSDIDVPQWIEPSKRTPTKNPEDKSVTVPSVNGPSPAASPSNSNQTKSFSLSVPVLPSISYFSRSGKPTTVSDATSGGDASAADAASKNDNKGSSPTTVLGVNVSLKLPTYLQGCASSWLGSQAAKTTNSPEAHANGDAAKDAPQPSSTRPPALVPLLFSWSQARTPASAAAATASVDFDILVENLLEALDSEGPEAAHTDRVESDDTGALPTAVAGGEGQTEARHATKPDILAARAAVRRVGPAAFRAAVQAASAQSAARPGDERGEADAGGRVCAAALRAALVATAHMPEPDADAVLRAAVAADAAAWYGPASPVPAPAAGGVLAAARDAQARLAGQLCGESTLLGSRRLRSTAALLAGDPAAAGTERLAGSRRLAGVRRIWLGGGPQPQATHPSTTATAPDESAAAIDAAAEAAVAAAAEEAAEAAAAEEAAASATDQPAEGEMELAAEGLSASAAAALPDAPAESLPAAPAGGFGSAPAV